MTIHVVDGIYYSFLNSLVSKLDDGQYSTYSF